jgi:hypothetical protein
VTESSLPKNGPFAGLVRDLPASVVVFLVALPLSLGIAVASGSAPAEGYKVKERFTRMACGFDIQGLDHAAIEAVRGWAAGFEKAGGKVQKGSLDDLWRQLHGKKVA